ncbi:hypothetical protein V5O48_008690 [Marasmius crinis-equi]|uniref:Uncharacterized protein n=1 Tax=Marasmius crinis-equi TaxID=585013 RepID=A0ABR3FDP1_9AGAR
MSRLGSIIYSFQAEPLIDVFLKPLRVTISRYIVALDDKGGVNTRSDTYTNHARRPSDPRLFTKFPRDAPSRKANVVSPSILRNPNLARFYRRTSCSRREDVQSDSTNNVWGGVPPVILGLTLSKTLAVGANWARYNLAVTQRKDTEPSWSSGWSTNLPGAPPFDFRRLSDDESGPGDMVQRRHPSPQCRAGDVSNTKTNFGTCNLQVHVPPDD